MYLKSKFLPKGVAFN